MELTDDNLGVFAPDSDELEKWSDQVTRAREEYYTNPGPHLECDSRRRRPEMAPWWIPAGPVRTLLEQALEDLWAARHRVASQRRLIVTLERRIIELETKTGERDGEGKPLPSVRWEGTGHGPKGHRPVQPALRRCSAGENDEAKERDKWTA